MRGAASAADVRPVPFAQFPRIGSGDFGIAAGACAPAPGNGCGEFLVAGTAANEVAQISSFGGEQTGVERTLRGQACARTVLAERLRHRRDETDFAGPVLVAPALGDFTDVVRIDRLDRKL